MPDNLPPAPGEGADPRLRPGADGGTSNLAPTGAAPTGGRHWVRNLSLALAGVVILVAVVIWLIEYLLVGQYFVSTADAYLAADSSMIATRVSGYIVSVPVGDNEIVKRGQVLAQVDPRRYNIALASAAANLRSAQAAIVSDTAQIGLQQARITQAAAAVAGDQARAAFAARNSRRYASLSGTGASTEQSNEQASTDVATANAALAADNAALLGARRQVDVLNAAILQAQASQAQAQSQVQQAALDLLQTKIVAPFDGMVGNKTVAVGDYVQTGTQLMAVVPLAGVYVIANYKETQLTHLVPGQAVTIDVDAFPALKVTGTVASIAPASGQEFALLPPDNATGNFTKIVQRVPVKIWLNLDRNLIGKLRPGMSVEPDIDTRPPKH